MTNKDKILEDIQRHNDAHDMDFKMWMMWGITQITVMTAMILDKIENIDHNTESEVKDE